MLNQQIEQQADSFASFVVDIDRSNFFCRTTKQTKRKFLAAVVAVLIDVAKQIQYSDATRSNKLSFAVYYDARCLLAAIHDEAELTGAWQMLSCLLYTSDAADE